MMKSQNWICYLIISLDDSQTYIGSTPDFNRRLAKHNSGRGAKRTMGRVWLPVLIIEGFHDKRACLSFESGWKRLYKTRCQERLYALNLMANANYAYQGKDPLWNRLLDLLYFTHHVSLLDTQYRLNSTLQHPRCLTKLMIHVMSHYDLEEMPWPALIEVS